jgi:nicotinate-nucleotide--dimethylbenzimidazole phosphoribosyltransferase
MAGPLGSTFDRSSAAFLRPREASVPDPDSPPGAASAPGARPVSDHPGDGGEDQKWSSLMEAASLHRPIIPLPGTVPSVVPASEAPRPAPIPEPLRAPHPLPRPAIQEEAANVAPPPEAAPAVEPEAAEPDIVEPETSRPAIPEEAAEPRPPIVSAAPEEALPPPAIEAPPQSVRRNGRLWLLAALVLLCTLIAGAGLLQALRHARKISQVNRQVATVEVPAPPPPVIETRAAPPLIPANAEAESPAAAPAQTAPPAAPAAPRPPPVTAVAAETVARPIIVYHRRAAAAADRVADRLRPLARQVDVRTATTIPSRPTIRYFQPEDAATAQALAVALGRGGGEWRVQDRTARHRQHPPGAVEVWLPDR